MNWTARGQATYDYRYWFDTDSENQQTGTATGNSWHMDVDVSGLSSTFHALHMQVKDTAGIWSVPVTTYFIKLPDPHSYWGYYWFDEDFSTMTRTAATNSKFQIDILKLDRKLHQIHYQLNNPANDASVPRTAFFFKSLQSGTARFRYWTDNNTDNIRTAECADGVMMLDMTDEKDGFHVLNVCGEMSGELTQAHSKMFIKIPQTEGGGDLTCLCYVDGDLYKQEKVPSVGGIIDWTFDVSSLSNGFHRILVQVVTPSGAATNVHESFFFRTTMHGELQNMKLIYSVDGEEYKTQAGIFNTGMFHFDIDVASLNEGIHRLTYMLGSETGSTTKINTAFFMKNPMGKSGIVSYKYWLNDYEDEARFVELSERQNPFELVSLLPVDECPIRSTCFQFEIEEDGIPMIYAKNDIYLQFFDVSNRIAKAHKQYVDYNVGEKIEELTLLESDKRVYKAKPKENKIHWFKVEALQGDSLSLKTDQACTLQIFSPSGKEVYNKSGSATVSYDGIHAEEDGVFYVALHDVTGTKGNNIALDFKHIDKYDVLHWDVSTVGNGGASTITYDGNGFENLYAIDYVNANGDTVKCDFIDHVSDAVVSATTDFNGVALGSYKAIFHFTKGDRVLENIVKVEAAKEIVLESKVTYPAQYLKNTSVTYTLNIENKGNMTAYRVPLYVYIASPTENGIQRIDIDGLGLPELLDGLNKDYLSTEWLEYEEEMRDEHYFLHALQGYDEDLKDSVAIRSAYFFVDVAPGTTKNISLSLLGNESVNVWFTLPENMPVVTDYSVAGKNSIHNEYCCIRDRVECLGRVLGDAVTFSNTLESITDIPHVQALEIADCVVDSLNTTISAVVDLACGEGNVEVPFHERLRKIKDGISISSIIVECYEKFLKGTQFLTAKELSEIVGLSTHATTWADCAKSFSQKRSACSSLASIGGISNPVNSWTPNDIYGYRAESGSKAVKKDWTDVYYTIEFENDIAFATASAQDVYLTDTLDSRYFDLKSFAPTRLKIGDRKIELSGDANFVTTVDMRPKINAIAQIECKYDEQRGIANWHFTSLDPMTMEHVELPIDGFLPINNSEGDGQGEVSFNVRLKTNLADGEEIPNRASVVFDMNKPIITPTWINVVDAIAPQSAVVETVMKNDSIMTISFNGTDNISGVWRYDLYVQAGMGTSWFKLAENLTNNMYDYRVYEGIDYGFCVIATDSAGNVEQKELIREGVVLDYLLGDVNGDERVSVLDLTMVTNAILRKEDEGFNAKAADLNMDGCISIVDAAMITNIILKK